MGNGLSVSQMLHVWNIHIPSFPPECGHFSSVVVGKQSIYGSYGYELAENQHFSAEALLVDLQVLGEASSRNVSFRILVIDATTTWFVNV